MGYFLKELTDVGTQRGLRKKRGDFACLPSLLLMTESTLLLLLLLLSLTGDAP